MGTVSVILPTYNEAANIGVLIDSILSLELDSLCEIIVVDDNSPDGTADIVERIGLKNTKVNVLRRVKDKGLVNSLNDGIRAAKGDYVVWMDSDLQMPSSLIPTLLGSIESGFDAAIGSRFIGKGSDERYVKGKNKLIVLVHKQLSKVMCFFFYYILRLPVLDISSGYIAIRKSVFQNYTLKGNYGEYFLDLVIHFKNNKLKIIEHPYVLERRKFGNSKTQANGYWGMIKIGFGFLKFAIKGIIKF